MLDKHIQEKEKAKNKVDVSKIKISTTNNIDGYIVEEYIDVISYEVVLGTGIISEFSAQISDLLGDRSGAFESKLSDLRESSLRNIKRIASDKGGDAVIGMHFDFITFANNILGLVVTGTVVTTKEKVHLENVPNVLEKLYELKNKQIISMEEYNEKRKILLDKIK